MIANGAGIIKTFYTVGNNTEHDFKKLHRRFPQANSYDQKIFLRATRKKKQTINKNFKGEHTS